MGSTIKAIDAQQRIVSTIESIVNQNRNEGDIAILSHGGVGALLLSHLLKRNISRDFDQPLNGGGNYFYFEKDTFKVLCEWSDISKF